MLEKYGKDLYIGDIASSATKVSSTNLFGDQIPYGDPYWYQGFKSPYYNESHYKFRAKVRDFVEKELMPYIHEWDEKGEFPNELHEKSYKAGIYGAIWPKEYGGTPPENCDAFHHFILTDEMARCASNGLMWSFTSFVIALPPILNYGSQYLKDWIARFVIS